MMGDEVYKNDLICQMIDALDFCDICTVSFIKKGNFFFELCPACLLKVGEFFHQWLARTDYEKGDEICSSGLPPQFPFEITEKSYNRINYVKIMEKKLRNKFIFQVAGLLGIVIVFLLVYFL